MKCCRCELLEEYAERYDHYRGFEPPFDGEPREAIVEYRFGSLFRHLCFQHFKEFQLLGIRNPVVLEPAP